MTERGDSSVTCSECGFDTVPGERFCAACGAPTEAAKTAPVLVTTLIAAAMAIGLIILLSRNGNPVAVEDGLPMSPSTTNFSLSTTTTLNQLPVPVTPASISCTAELPAFPCDALFDGDPDTAWNAPAAGLDVDIVIAFEKPVHVASLSFRNHVDDERLMRNARLHELEIHLDGTTTTVTADLQDGHGPFVVPIPLESARGLTIHVVSVYAAEAYGGREPFDELALAEIQVLSIAP